MDTSIDSRQLRQGSYSSRQTENPSQPPSEAMEKGVELIGRHVEEVNRICQAIDQLKKRAHAISEGNSQQSFEDLIQKVEGVARSATVLASKANETFFALYEVKETAHLQDEMHRAYEGRQISLDSV